VRGGTPLLFDGLGRGGTQLLRFAGLLILSFLAAGLAEVLIPREAIAGTMGHDSGLRGILLATGAGVITPAGPFVAFPMAAALRSSGASMACIVAYVTGWSLLAVHRFVAWELPILGPRFALLRYAVSLALPVAAGLVTRALTRP
jgi:uncharacterized membrane protein YraQ (UPF0718 family)